MTTYSHSRIGCFESCPLKYKYTYIDKLRSDSAQTIEAFLGSRVHETMERLYKDLKFEKRNSLDEMLSYYNGLWQKHWNDEITIVRKEYNAENYRLMGEKFISDYFKRNQPFDDGTTLGLEQRISLDLDGTGRYMLTGFVDRISMVSDSHYRIHDYKTAGSLPLQKYLDEDRQLALYEIALRKMYDDAKRVELVWHYMAFNKDMKSERTPQQLEELKRSIMAKIDAIEKAREIAEFPARESALCSWCEHRAICPLHAHEAKVESLAPSKYAKDPGVKLVNDYYRLTSEKRKIENELDALKDAMVEKCRNENLSVLMGSDVRASVKSYENLRFPSKGCSERCELEEMLKKCGKWDEVSALDNFALSKIVTSQAWDKETLEKLKKFATKDTTTRIFLGKIKDSE